MEVTEKTYEKAKKCKVSKSLIGYEVDGKYMVDDENMECSCGVKNCQHVVAVAIKLGKEVSVSKEGVPIECIGGYDKYEVISAFHKELRRGDKREAYYWLEVMIQSGFSAWYINNYIVSILGEELCLCDMKPFQEIKELANFKVVDEYNLYAMVEKFCEAKKWWYCEKCSQRRFDWSDTLDMVERGRKKVPMYALDTHTRRGKMLHAEGKADMRWSGTLKGMRWRRRVVEAGLDPIEAAWNDVDMSDEKELDEIENQ
jgi:hypothetical protein